MYARLAATCSGDMVDGRPLGDTVQNCVGDNEEQKSKQGSINKNHGDNFPFKNKAPGNNSGCTERSGFNQQHVVGTHSGECSRGRRSR